LTEDAQENQMPERVDCPVCSNEDTAIQMIEVAPGSFVCPDCETSVETADSGKKARLKQDLGNDVDQYYWWAPEPGFYEIPTPNLRVHLEAAWLNLVLGRYIAAVILTSVFVEALVKEAVFLKTGTRPSGGGGTLNAILAEDGKEVLRDDDLAYLRAFTEGVRNIWVHLDQESVTRGGTVLGWKINIYEEQREDESILDTLGRVTDEVKEGNRDPVELRAKDYPFVENQLFREAAKRMAYPLYEDVWMFGYRFIQRYLSSKDYERFHLEHGNRTPDPAYDNPDADLAEWFEDNG
jgi:hypothetical protein